MSPIQTTASVSRWVRRLGRAEVTAATPAATDTDTVRT